MSIQNITDVARGVANAPQSVKEITPELLSNISTMITILQAAGIIFLLYMIYLVFSGIISWKNNRRIKDMHEKLNLIESRIKDIGKSLIEKDRFFK